MRSLLASLRRKMGGFRMEFPENKTEFMRECDIFRHSGLLSVEERHWFDDMRRTDTQKWEALASDDEVSLFQDTLSGVLKIGFMLYQNDDFKTVVVNALTGIHHKHQLVSFDERADVSQHALDLRALFDKASLRFQQSEQLDDVITKDDVKWFFKTTKNRYFLVTLYLCVLRETFYSPYWDFVDAKASFYPYTLSFWKPFEQFEHRVPAQAFWMDMMSDLIAPMTPYRKFSAMVDATEAENA